MIANPLHRAVPVAFLCLLLLTSGCVAIDHFTEGRSHGGDVDIVPTERGNTTPPFVLQGEVHFRVDASATSFSRFENVSLCLYAPNGTVIASEPLGTVEPPTTYVNFSVRTETVPGYIYVHHPDFFSIEGFDNELLVYRPEADLFGPGTVADLPFAVDRLSETRCTPE